MAEVVGLAASIIQIAGAGTKLSLALYNFTTSAVRADQDIKDIADDVELTSNALESVGRVFEIEDAKSIISKKAIQDANNIIKKCESVFNEISEIVEKRRKDGKDGKKSLSLMGKLSFPAERAKDRTKSEKARKLEEQPHLTAACATACARTSPRMEKSVMEEEREKIRELHQRQQDSIRSLQALESKLCNVTLDDEETLQGSVAPSRVPTIDLVTIAHPTSMPPLEKTDSQATSKTITTDLSVIDDLETSESDAAITDDEDEHLSLEELSQCAKQVQKLLKRITMLQNSVENNQRSTKHRKKRVHKMYRRFCRKFESNINVAPVPHQTQRNSFSDNNRSGVRDDRKTVNLQTSYGRIVNHGVTTSNVEHDFRPSYTTSATTTQATSDSLLAHLQQKGRAKSAGPIMGSRYTTSESAYDLQMPAQTRLGLDPATQGNHALEHWEMQLMLLEQQNKKRLVMARQEKDIGASDDPRDISLAGNEISQPPVPVKQMKRSGYSGISMSDDVSERGVETHPAGVSIENDSKGSVNQPSSVAKISGGQFDSAVSQDDVNFDIHSPQAFNENVSDSQSSTSALYGQENTTLDNVEKAANSAVHYTRTGRISKGKKGRKVHICECGRSYTRKEHLERHRKTHSVGEPNACEYPGCGKQFYRVDLLRRHQERHEVTEGEQQKSIDILPPLHSANPMSMTAYYGVQPQLTEATAVPESDQQHASHSTPLAPVPVDILPPINWNDPPSHSHMNYPLAGYANSIPGLADYANMAVPLLPESYWEEKERHKRRWCDECKKLFQSEEEFTKHLSSHSREKSPERVVHSGKKLKEFFGEEPKREQSTAPTRFGEPENMVPSDEEIDEDREEPEPRSAPFVSGIQISSNASVPRTAQHSTSVAPSGDEPRRKRSWDSDNESDDDGGDLCIPETPAHAQDSQEAGLANHKKGIANSSWTRDAKKSNTDASVAALVAAATTAAAIRTSESPPADDGAPNPPNPSLSPDTLEVSRKRVRESDAASEEDGSGPSPKRTRASSDDMPSMFEGEEAVEEGVCEDDDERDIVDILLEQWTVPVA